MATMNVSLPDPTKECTVVQSRSGRYSNTSDYVRDLIRRDQNHHQAIAALQQAVEEGHASGPPESFDVEAFLADKTAAHANARGQNPTSSHPE